MKKEEAIQYAIERFSKPSVHLRVTLASSPEAAKVIVGALPGVKELIEVGPEAAGAALALLRTDEDDLASENLSTIGLYVLHHISTPETTQALAQMVAEDSFTGINNQLAAEAYLRSSGIKAAPKDAVAVAKKSAKKFRA
jgi:hypothetical protein